MYASIFFTVSQFMTYLQDDLRIYDFITVGHGGAHSPDRHLRSVDLLRTTPTVTFVMEASTSKSAAGSLPWQESNS